MDRMKSGTILLLKPRWQIARICLQIWRMANMSFRAQLIWFITWGSQAQLAVGFLCSHPPSSKKAVVCFNTLFYILFIFFWNFDAKILQDVSQPKPLTPHRPSGQHYAQMKHYHLKYAQIHIYIFFFNLAFGYQKKTNVSLWREKSREKILLLNQINMHTNRKSRTVLLFTHYRRKVTKSHYNNMHYRFCDSSSDFCTLLLFLFVFIYIYLDISGNMKIYFFGLFFFFLRNAPPGEWNPPTHLSILKSANEVFLFSDILSCSPGWTQPAPLLPRFLSPRTVCLQAWSQIQSCSVMSLQSGYWNNS